MIYYNIQLWLIFNLIFIPNFIRKEKNQKVYIYFMQKKIKPVSFRLELIQKREEIVSRFTDLSQAVQPLLDAVVTEDAARLIEHQRNSDSMLALNFLQKNFNV
jgi:hypothetical protein